MCGIAGVWSNSSRSAERTTGLMIQMLKHRGPDSDGLWTDTVNGMCLGHRRLAIVDLSKHGHQPMTSLSRRYTVVLNGEIYNHLEIRRQLNDTQTWLGHSDTETFLAAIDRWGVERTLNACVGMFAFALWDASSRTLVLGRDRFGEKPLYYGFTRHGIAFASELKALRLYKELDLSLDLDAAAEYMQIGYIGCPRSIYKGVRKLPQGTLLTIDSASSRPEPTAYWTLPQPTSSAHEAPNLGERHYLEKLHELLSASVKRQMLSDVPLGAFLSGGIDSSLIVALMQRASSQPVRTFSIGIADSGTDESRHARDIASHLETAHTELILEPNDALALIPNLATVYDEPFADSSQIPMLLLSRLTRHHVTVALSGDAGDELFGGYNRHVVAAKLARVLASCPLSLRRSIAAVVSTIPASTWDFLSAQVRSRGWRHMPPELGEKIARIAAFLAAPSGKAAYLSTVSQGYNSARGQVATDDGLLSPRNLIEFHGVSLPQQMMWWDMKTYLPDDILVKVDRASMAYSLETRVPFLDHRIAEFALQTPMEFKIRNGQSKWLLRSLLSKYVPVHLFERPKQGFTLPIDHWLRGPLREWAESLLSPRKIKDGGLLDSIRVQNLWKEHLSRRRNHQRALWTILMLQNWAHEHMTY